MTLIGYYTDKLPDPKRRLRVLREQMEEIREYLSGEPVRGKHYTCCKGCGRLTPRCPGDLCFECEEKARRKSLERVLEEYIGSKIVDFKIGLLEDFFTVTAFPPTYFIKELILQKDSKKIKLKGHCFLPEEALEEREVKGFIL